MWAMRPGSRRRRNTGSRRRRASVRCGPVSPLLEVGAVLLQSLCHRLANRHLEQRLEQPLDAGGRSLGTEGDQRRVVADRSKALVDEEALVGARDDFRREASIGIAMLHDLIGLQHAEQSDFLAKTAVVALFRKHGEAYVRMNAMARVMSHVAELAADDRERTADRCLYLDVDRSHRTSPRMTRIAPVRDRKSRLPGRSVMLQQTPPFPASKRMSCAIDQRRLAPARRCGRTNPWRTACLWTR